mmetsp:Transcript_14269/g.32431  ORF Transcript_14269/g.32431 Transcript_14269/m.32431 type:complete len:261 (-) Transcript_14269:297-1079(-)
MSDSELKAEAKEEPILPQGNKQTDGDEERTDEKGGEARSSKQEEVPKVSEKETKQEETAMKDEENEEKKQKKEEDEDPLPRRPARNKPGMMDRLFRSSGAGAARMTEPSSKALDLFDSYAPYRIGPDADSDKDPWCLPVLRTEAMLRLDESYLTDVGRFFDEGLTPPIDLCEAVELAALEAHGLKPGMLDAYRFAARSLSKDERSEIFFLRANDELFRPKAKVVGEFLTGDLLDWNLQTVPCQDMLSQQPRTLIIAASTS